MGTSLNGLTPANTYEGLIKTGDNTEITTTAKALSDGNGNNLPIEVATTGINFTSGLTKGGTNVATTADIPPAVTPAGTDGQIQFNSSSAFGADSNLYWDNTAKQLQLGGSDNTGSIPIGLKLRPNLSSSFGPNIYSYYNNDKWLQIYKGTSYYTFADKGLGMNLGQFVTPTAQLQVKGSGSTSATTSLLVQNSSGTEMLKVADDSKAYLNGTLYINRDNALNAIYLGNSAGATKATIHRGENGGLILQGGPIFYKNGINIGAGQNDITFYTDSIEKMRIDINGNLAIGTTLANTSSVVDITSTTKGFLPPRMTTTQKNAISSPAEGLMVMDITTHKLCVYDGTSWVDLH